MNRRNFLASAVAAALAPAIPRILDAAPVLSEASLEQACVEMLDNFGQSFLSRYTHRTYALGYAFTRTHFDYETHQVLIEEIDNVFEDHPVGWRNVFDESNPALVEEEEVGEWDGRAVGSIVSDLSQ